MSSADFSLQCNHYDLSDFHKEYQDSKPVIRNFTNSQIKQTNFNQSFEQPSSVPYGRLGDVSDLIGVGSIGNLASTTPQNTSFSLDAANIEFDEILDETRAQQLLPGSLAAPLYQFPNNRGFVDPTTVASPVVYSAPLNNVEALVSESSVPIGRLVDHYRMEWTCRGRDGQANSMIWGSEPETCNRRCRSLDELHNHFNQTHALIQDSGYATKCENCNIAWWRTCLYPQPSSQCPRCGIDRSDNWCYGSISSTPSLTSAPSSTYVESQDGSAIILPRSSTYPSTYNMNPTGSQNNSFMGSQGQSWGSYGGYYQARYASVVPVRPKNSRAHFQYSPDSHAADCAPFGKLSMTPPSSHYSSLYSDFTTRISSLKPALPIPTAWLLIMLLAILALIETWFPVAAVLAITNTTFGIGIEMLAACRNRILVFLVMCIAVGCVGMWLCKYTGICRTPEEAGISVCHLFSWFRPLPGVLLGVWPIKSCQSNEQHMN
ncbi:hypothetical protein B0T17DRAFT_543414 [Bombardia bombarda]|uniref:Uncharacterized protein n=1 Tax=Bombardia bombarda TaxID=252184 RepID=A0AA39TPG3_9PEZI|nr:hypothetical protein B0T17DRAFT_543414 [Bombardia bombarda]